MLPLRPRPPLTQDEMAVLLPPLPPLPTSLPDAVPFAAATVLNLRDQRNGLRGIEKARRIFLAAFVAMVEAWAAGMISTCGAGVGAGAMDVDVTMLVVCVGSSSVSCVGVGVVAFSVVSASAVAVVVVVVALALLWVAAASAAGAATALAAAASSFCCTFVPIFYNLTIRHIK